MRKPDALTKLGLESIRELLAQRAAVGQPQKYELRELHDEIGRRLDWHPELDAAVRKKGVAAAAERAERMLQPKEQAVGLGPHGTIKTTLYDPNAIVITHERGLRVKMSDVLFDDAMVRVGLITRKFTEHKQAFETERGYWGTRMAVWHENPMAELSQIERTAFGGPLAA